MTLLHAPRNESTGSARVRTIGSLACLALALTLASGCGSFKARRYETLGKITRLAPEADALIPAGARMEILASGFDWTEGPVWVSDGDYLLFSDIPPNTVFKWKEGEGVSVYLKPSGYTGEKHRAGEPGSNGLLLDTKGRLVSCEHGNRRISVMIDTKAAIKKTLADRYEGKRFNSPNDAVFKSNGDLYFTDPPYGLERRMEDPAKELDFQGVYRLDPSGQVTLLTREMTRPNGIGFSPDEKTLYVANSDRPLAIWKAFPVKDDGTLGEGKVLFDATEWVKQGRPGLPDGMVIDAAGNLFATGPGGVLVFTPEGKHIATLETGQATSNCTFGEDGSVLYITADMHLARVRLNTKGLLFR